MIPHLQRTHLGLSKSTDARTISVYTLFVFVYTHVASPLFYKYLFTASVTSLCFLGNQSPWLDMPAPCNLYVLEINNIEITAELSNKYVLYIKHTISVYTFFVLETLMSEHLA